MMQHVMYKDILANRSYVSYPYYDKFDINDKSCLYCYRDNEMDMHDYIDNVTSPQYIENHVIAKIRETNELSDEDADKLIRLFSSRNPSVRLTVYGGGRIDRASVFEDVYNGNDMKKVFIELTGEINAFAMNGLYSLYASALYYLEGAEDTENAKAIQECYTRLINSSYIYMKRGTAMEFFFMPIEDIEKAIEKKSIDMLMESVYNFTNVYIRNNKTSELEL